MIQGQSKTEANYRAIQTDSSSSLKEFSMDRKKYHKKYVLGENVEDKENQAATIGRLVETLLLEPEQFDNRFYMSACANTPTGLMLDFVEALYRVTKEATDDFGVVTRTFDELTKDAYLEQLNTLLTTYKYAEANKGRGDLIVSINRSMGNGYNTSLSDFLESNPLTLMSSGQIAQIEVRAKVGGKENKTPEQIKNEEKARTQGDLEAKAELYKTNPELAKLLYGKSSTGGGGESTLTPEQLKAIQDGLKKG